ncbi:hypothetical protein K457DRAFT_121658 [Linnemannia elongata AG-77]|uniref:Chromosome transmission fidelity protein 8 n=1 Tax=Linnemannia elongata AG-77 TaxID=1314771 RepID=A0A197KBD6_9FUNG|nr:hypothetical protein K457DRAFT_121658 [Linnemannia elongata AG-77]
MVLISIPTTVADRTQTATTLATCVDTKSTLMLEFQGIIEMDGQTWAGNALGQLSILDGGVKAQLVIGNHRLDGKVVKLDKPLLLIQKQQKPKDSQDVTTGTAGGKGKNKDSSNRRQSFGLPSHYHHQDEDDTMNSTTDFSAATTTNNTDATGLSADPLAPSNIKDTVQYDTVAVIRQKILFNTMPVPIIHQERRGLTVIKRGV